MWGTRKGGEKRKKLAGESLRREYVNERALEGKRAL
jgi:hypothetical protein